ASYAAAASQYEAKKELIDTLGPAETELNRLTHDRDTIQSTVNMLADRGRDLEMRKGARMRTARLVEPAVAPTSPIRPRKAQSILISAILALLLAVSSVFLQEFLDDRVNSPLDVEQVTTLPTLANVPSIEAGQSRLIAALSANSPIAEAYR